MSTSLAQVNNSMTVWDDASKLNEIRKLFANKLTEMEFQFFIGLGKATNLNPFTREIWCVKYQDNMPAQVFIGRDGYRKAAQAHSEYDYHQCDAVYENDVFEVHNGEVKHSYTLVNRGALVGAYCITKRHTSSRPMYVFAELKEYSTGKSLWNSQTGKPATMIKKVAESQCLRACFQDLLGGTYGEEEMASVNMEDNGFRVIKGATQTEKLNKILKERDNNEQKAAYIDSDDCPHKSIVIDNDDVYQDGYYGNPSNKSPITAEQIGIIKSLFENKKFNEERIDKALSFHRVKDLSEMTEHQANIFIKQLEKVQ